jgi:hypothetical protein
VDGVTAEIAAHLVCYCIALFVIVVVIVGAAGD